MLTDTDIKTIVLTIDGIAVTGSPEETVLQVARRHDIYIPTLCYHEELAPYGGCRLCLVDIKGMRGLTTSCTTKIAPGMEVVTESPEIERTRRITMELMLADHPMECLICAQNEHCELQKVAAYLGIDNIRFPATRERLPLDTSNPFFIFDPNKCILCGRCVRTCVDRQGLGAIGLNARGAATIVGTARDLPLVGSSCESCGECVVRCPVGARANRDYLHPTRYTKSVCTFCGTGCGMLIGTRGGKIVAVEGDPDSRVSHGNLCVKGRYGFKFVNSPKRLTTPLIKRNGVFEEATWDEALDLVASKFKEYLGDQFAAVSSSRGTNEENYIVQKFTRAVMGTNNVDNCARLCHSPTVAGLSKAFGTGGGTNPVDDIAGAECIFVIGSNTTEAHPVAGVQVRKAAEHATLIVADPREIELAQHADLWLPLRPGTDVALLMGIARVIVEEGLHDPEFIAARVGNFDEFVQALAPYDLATVEQITGVPRESIVKAARLYASTKPALLMYSLGITEHSHGSDNVQAIANLALLTGNVGKPSAGVMPMRGQNNVQGACDMGCGPNYYQGYQYVTQPENKLKFEQAWGAPMRDDIGLTLVEYFEQALAGKIKALYVVGMDVAYSIADANHIQEALRRMDFVVFQDIFLSGSAEFADVVLPAASFAEKDGTFTNLERRVQLLHPAIPPVGDAKPDWWITCEIAKRMGAQGFDYANAAEIMDEIARLTPSFAGLSFARLDAEGGIQWPCTDPDHPGTPRLHVEKFNTPTGLGHLAPLVYRPSAESPDEEYPFLLSTGRSLNHFHLAMTSKVTGLMELEPEETVRMHPDDADHLGIEHGEMVKVSSRRGSLEVRANIVDNLQPGMAWMTFHFYESPTNVLTNLALDPVSKTPEFKVTAIKIEKLTNASAKKAKR
ncbi:MAG: formate dehydrogenase subunit alpha [Armatimonadota bacterium]